MAVPTAKVAAKNSAVSATADKTDCFRLFIDCSDLNSHLFSKSNNNVEPIGQRPPAGSSFPGYATAADKTDCFRLFIDCSDLNSHLFSKSNNNVEPIGQRPPAGSSFPGYATAAN